MKLLRWTLLALTTMFGQLPCQIIGIKALEQKGSFIAPKEIEKLLKKTKLIDPSLVFINNQTDDEKLKTSNFPIKLSKKEEVLNNIGNSLKTMADLF